MNFNDFFRGLEILKPYVCEAELDNVPNAFDNGTPNHSHKNYMSVMIGTNEPSDDEVIELKTLGWVEEYPYWCFYDPNPFVVPTREELLAK